MKDRIKPSDENFNFVDAEHSLLKFWDERKIFKKSLDKNPSSNPYIFYDGPPFATGLPHHGHLVGSILKDAVPRYWTMKGKFVQRRLVLLRRPLGFSLDYFYIIAERGSKHHPLCHYQRRTTEMAGSPCSNTVSTTA